MRFSLGYFRLFLFASFLCLVMGVPAWADLVISGRNATVAAGGTGSVNFYITSNSDAGDNLSLFSLELQITPVVPTGSFLQFTAVQSEPYLDSSYVFSGSSGFSDFSIPFWSAPSSPTTPNGTIAGGDFNDGTLSYTAVTSSSNFLLATVQFWAPPGSDTIQSYAISLVADQTSFSDVNSANINYSSTAATVTVTPDVTPVPEPSTLVVFSSLAVMWTVIGRRRRKRPAG
jgi:hypothetical protein